MARKTLVMIENFLKTPKDYQTWFVFLVILHFVTSSLSLSLVVIFLLHQGFASVAIAALKSMCSFTACIICHPLLLLAIKRLVDSFKRGSLCVWDIQGQGSSPFTLAPGSRKFTCLHLHKKWMPWSSQVWIWNMSGVERFSSQTESTLHDFIYCI